MDKSVQVDESLQIDEHGDAERMHYRYVGYETWDLSRALFGNGPEYLIATESETLHAAIHTAALLEDAERSKVVCRECMYWHEYASRENGACCAPGTKKEPWFGKPYHETGDCAGDFGCVCGVRK